MTSSRFDRTIDPHVSDGVLLALYDAKRAPELDASRTHVEQCSDCQARSAAIAANAGRVRASLLFVPIPSVTEDAFRRRLAGARARRAPVWRRPAWQAAAALVLIAGAAAAAGPIRDWVRRRIERPRTQVRPAPAPSAPDSLQSTSRSGTTISFAVAGPEFIVRFDSLPTTGSLAVVRGTTPLVSARIASGDGTGGDEMVVLPAELRVRNTSASRASYELSIPAAVTRLRVIVAGRTLFDGAPPASVRLDRSQ